MKKSCTLNFITPAMIKSKGRATAVPDICSYFQSVVNKYNTFENAPISFDEFKEAFYNSFLDSYELKSTKYNVSENVFPGMTGICKIIFPIDKRQNLILRRMIVYATYSGIGGKTGQGMGGLVII